MIFSVLKNFDENVISATMLIISQKGGIQKGVYSPLNTILF